MLDDALKERPDHTILVKRHPDATLGGKQSYFSDERLVPHRANPRLVVVEHEVNPHTLFDQVDEVWVVSSGMGMEALLRGLPVRCYGAPFYAGWGLTEDRREVPRRGRTRSVVELFHFAYIESCRYYSPSKHAAAELEDVIADLSQRKQAVRPQTSSHGQVDKG
jgi:capsule polysaccharide export protein KpsC/LpsZ